MPDHMPEDMPDRMPNRMSEDMSDRMPEDLPVRKCINVMVGITRSKVIWLCLVAIRLYQLTWRNMHIRQGLRFPHVDILSFGSRFAQLTTNQNKLCWRCVLSRLDWYYSATWDAAVFRRVLLLLSANHYNLAQQRKRFMDRNSKRKKYSSSKLHWNKPKQ